MSGMTGLFTANSLSVCQAGKFQQMDCLWSVSDFMVNTFFKDFNSLILVSIQSWLECNGHSLTLNFFKFAKL